MNKKKLIEDNLDYMARYGLTGFLIGSNSYSKKNGKIVISKVPKKKTKRNKKMEQIEKTKMQNVKARDSPVFIFVSIECLLINKNEKENFLWKM